MSKADDQLVEFADEVDELGTLGAITAVVQGTDWTRGRPSLTQIDRGSILTQSAVPEA